MKNSTPPKYAALGRSKDRAGTTMRLDGKEYYRDNGEWGIEFEIIDGAVLAKSEEHPHLHGLEFTKITRKEWAEENTNFERQR